MARSRPPKETAPNLYSPSGRRPWPLLWWGLGLVAVTALLGVAVAANPERPFTTGLDHWWAELVGNGDQYGFPAVIFESLNSIWFYALTTALYVVLLLMRHWRSTIYAALVLAGAPILTATALQPLVTRPRPHVTMTQLTAAQGIAEGSFPSGHCTAAAVTMVCVAAIVARRARPWAWGLGAVLVLGTVWQRTMSNAHWLSDALAGAAVGAGIGLVVWWAFYPAIRRDFVRGAARRAAREAEVAGAADSHPAGSRARRRPTGATA